MTDSYSGLHDPYTDQLAAARYRAERDQTREELAKIKADRSWHACEAAGMMGAKEDRRAVAWVREHGGLEHVKETYFSACALSGDLAEWKREVYELCERIGVRHEDHDGEYEMLQEAYEVLGKRLMPEGMEWPRFEDGEPVRPGDRLLDKDGDWFEAVSFVFTRDWWSVRGYQMEGFGDLNDETRRKLEGMAYGTRVKRPAPKVLDADGVEIRVGDTVWHVHDLDKFTVTNPNNGENLSVSCMGEDGKEYCCYPNGLTHRAPVLAADGRPLREWETVWSTDSGTRYTVEKVTDELIPIKCCSEMGSTVSLHPSQLTHERPEIDSWERLEEDVANASCPDVYCANHHIDASDTSYEWAMARDIVRRAMALAERDA